MTESSVVRSSFFGSLCYEDFSINNKFYIFSRCILRRTSSSSSVNEIVFISCISSLIFCEFKAIEEETIEEETIEDPIEVQWEQESKIQNEWSWVKMSTQTFCHTITMMISNILIDSFHHHIHITSQQQQGIIVIKKIQLPNP